MRPPQPIKADPFLTIITPAFRRPQQLLRNLASVGVQTAAEDIQHLVIPDHVGYGVVGGLFGRLKTYAPAVIGRYVNLLCDDDVLADESVVARVRAFAEQTKYPPVIVGYVRKGHHTLPSCDPVGEPICGHVDLTSFIVRSDVWLTHIDDYKPVYEGDFFHAKALFDAGISFEFCPLLWAIGAQSNGRPEY